MDADVETPDLPSGAAEIARGPVATVYLARDTATGADTAVKVFDRGVTPAHVDVVHPHAAPVTARGETGGLEFVATAYGAGGTLADTVGSSKLSWHETVGLGIRLAAALQAAHDLGTVHGGVKPTNVLFGVGGRDGEAAVLADFGHGAWKVAAEGAGGIELGFYAPEVLAGEDPTERADVYALAATLHYAMTGAPPFLRGEGEPLLATLGRILTEDPPDIRPLRVPDAVAAALERAMAKDPEVRHAGAREFAAALQEAERSHGHRVTDFVVADGDDSGSDAAAVDVTRPHLADTPPPTTRSSAKRWLLVIFATIATVAVSVVVALAVVSGRRPGDAPPATQAPPTAASNRAAPHPSTDATTSPAASTTTPAAGGAGTGGDGSVFPDIPGYHLTDLAQDSVVSNPDLADSIFQSAYVAGVRRTDATGPEVAVFTVLVLQPEYAGDPSALAAIISALAPEAQGVETTEIAGVALVVTGTADGQTLFAWQDTTELVANLLRGPDRGELEAFLAAPGVLNPQDP